MSNIKNKNKRWTTNDIELLRELYARGCSYAEIATALHRTKPAVAAQIKEQAAAGNIHLDRRVKAAPVQTVAVKEIVTQPDLPERRTIEIELTPLESRVVDYFFTGSSSPASMFKTFLLNSAMERLERG